MDKHVFVIMNREQAFELAHKISLINPQSDSQPVYQITVEEWKATRSGAQNRLYWLWLRQIADHINENKQEGSELFSDNDMHEWFKEKFLPTKLIDFQGTVVKAFKTTTKLTTKEFTDYLENIDRYCIQYIHLQLPHPEDLYYKAMGISRV